MTSQLIANKFSSYEGQWRASFLRDQTDPSKEFSDIADPTERITTALLRGRYLRGEVAKVRLRMDDSQSSGVLRLLTTYFTISESSG